MTMPDELEVAVTFDPKRGFIGTAAELRVAVTALSLGGLRRRVECQFIPDPVDVNLNLDRATERERDRRRARPRPHPAP